MPIWNFKIPRQVAIDPDPIPNLNCLCYVLYPLRVDPSSTDDVSFPYHPVGLRRVNGFMRRHICGHVFGVFMHEERTRMPALSLWYMISMLVHIVPPCVTLRRQSLAVEATAI